MIIKPVNWPLSIIVGTHYNFESNVKKLISEFEYFFLDFIYQSYKCKKKVVLFIALTTGLSLWAVLIEGWRDELFGLQSYFMGWIIILLEAQLFSVEVFVFFAGIKLGQWWIILATVMSYYGLARAFILLVLY